MNISGLLTILFMAIFVNNFVLRQFLGICPFLGVSKKIETSVGMGMAVMFVMTLASVITWFIDRFILELLDIQYLQTLAFILVIASLVQFVELALKKTSPTLYKALGIFLPLITTNCAVLGLAILNISNGFNLIETMFHAVGAALGFTLALVLLAGIRERMELTGGNRYFEGVPAALIAAAILAITFSGFVF